ncbi:MAG: CoA pyrophosphatase [Bacteriovoracaceae bacterium]|nr:CoA pyrophosphatase [Bacteriovoracaceae bacterium]
MTTALAHHNACGAVFFTMILYIQAQSRGKIVANMEFLQGLKHSLAANKGLYRNEAWSEMLPERTTYTSEGPLTSAAVLLLLFKQDNTWKFPLIERVEDGKHHSGQISFPGGRLELGETAQEAAIRETHEEIGVSPKEIEVIGELSPIPITVSNYLVFPFVAIVGGHFKWHYQAQEVADLFTVSVSELCIPEVKRKEIWNFKNTPRLIPYFNLHDKKIWGATAMILNEFAWHLKAQEILPS